MDHPRITSPPSIRVDFGHPYPLHSPPNRSTLHSSGTSKTFAHSASPKPIPNSRMESPPPPLPPPRFIEDLAVGRDPGWHWGNTPVRGARESEIGSGTVSLGSSLRSAWDRRSEIDEGIEDSEEYRQGSSAPRYKSPHEGDMYDYMHRDEGYSSLSGSSLFQKLQGERPLERRNRQDSSHAYDKSLLSRIGKPRTPPRASTSGSMDASPSPNAPYYNLPRHPKQLTSVSTSEKSVGSFSESPFKIGSPFGRKWIENESSGIVSPSLISSAASAKNYMDYRSPTFDNSSAASPVTEPERFGRVHEQSRRSDSTGSIMMTGGPDDGASSAAGRFKRGESYDQGGIFATESDLDSDFPMEETGGMRHLHLDDRAPPHPDHFSPPPQHQHHQLSHSQSRLGMKRRASSPPRQSAGDDQAPPQIAGGAATSELYQRRTSGHDRLSTNRASPVHQYHPTQSSVSSTSSGGLRTGSSYASSAGLSVGSSSITSVSSHDRSSPGGISPLSDQYSGARDSSYANSLSLDPNSRVPPSSHQRIPPDTKSAAAIARKMSTDNIGRGKPQNAPKLQANVHICVCCPKKPKKFDTIEELRHHQNEKQYFCIYCNNRFKNKNEAERHQNSLHVRRHSWSCATLDRNYEAAFHPNTAIPPHTNSNVPPPQPGVLAQTDVCGYCGLEFPNFPAPDWMARSSHLTNVHKFGECNQSKKFYRADHFRQHLKHSHAGTSGKWTNMLENACMKVEQPPLTPDMQNQEHFRQQQQQQQQLQNHLQGQLQHPLDAQQFQAQQLPSAPVANMTGAGPGMRPVGYSNMGMSVGMGMPGGNELQHQKIEEEMQEEM